MRVLPCSERSRWWWMPSREALWRNERHASPTASCSARDGAISSLWDQGGISLPRSIGACCTPTLGIVRDCRYPGRPLSPSTSTAVASRVRACAPAQAFAPSRVSELAAACPGSQQFSMLKRYRRAVACSGSRVALLSTSRLKGGAWEASSTLQQAPGWQSHREFTKNQGQLHGKSRLQALHRLWFDGNLLVRAMFSTRCCDGSAILRTAGWSSPSLTTRTFRL